MTKLANLSSAVSRRSFLAGSVSTGLFMGFGTLLSGCNEQQAVEEITDRGSEYDPNRLFSPAVWFEINTDGDVLINIAKAEMGQHVGTALARIVADELGADWSRVTIRHVDTDPKWGYMVTGGSWSVFTSFAALSQAGAAGRTVLLDAGASLLGVSTESCIAKDGQIRSGDLSISFAEIVQSGDISRTFSADELASLPIKSANQRDLIGKPIDALDIPEKSTGQATYGIDIELPNMVFAHPILPPTRRGSKILAVDDDAAKSISGYQQTLQLSDPSDEIQGWAVVIADSYPAAIKAAEAVKIEWQAGDTASVSEEDILAEGTKLIADKRSGVLVVNDGDVTKASRDAASTHSSTYRTHTALHFTLEPANALVEFKQGKCHIHAGNQWQSLVMPTLAKAFEMPESDIVIHQYYLGGGFGRRLWGDYMIPAGLAAKQLNKPVKLVFQRADDSIFDCVRSASVQRFDASLDSQNQVTGIEHAAAAGWPTLNLAPGFLADGVDGNGKYDTFSISGADHWYTLANHKVRAINNDLAQRTFQPGYLRAVAPGWIGWGVECFIDELAIKAQQDPIDFRLRMLDADGKNAGKAPEAVGGAARLAAVLRDVKARSIWGQELPKGEGLGVAVSHGQERTMPTWTAVIAHVAVDLENKKVSIKKMWQSIDCGTVVHPDGALAQAEGAMLWGVSLALHEGTRFINGNVVDRNLDTYTPLRMGDVPDMDITFMASTEMPTGLGEPPLIAIAPAIGNAIFAASGIRARDLPIKL